MQFENYEEYDQFRKQLLLAGALGYVWDLLDAKLESIADLEKKLERDFQQISGALAYHLREDVKFAGWITAVFETRPVKTEGEVSTVRIDAELYQSAVKLVGEHPELWSSTDEFIKDAVRTRLLEGRKEIAERSETSQLDRAGSEVK